MTSTQFLTPMETATLLPSVSELALKSAEALGLVSSSTTKATSILSSPKEAAWWRTNFALTGAGTSAKHVRRRGTKATRLVLPMPNHNTINDVQFSAVAPYTMAVATGPRVLLYNPSGGNSSLYRAMNRSSADAELMDKLDDMDGDKFEEGTTVIKSKKLNPAASPDKSIPFPGPVHTLAFRPDGRLIAIGGHEGIIRIVDINTKSIMRSFALASKDTVRSLHWLRDGKHLLSAGDDGLVHIWDISQPSRSTPVIVLRGHGDSVRDMVILYIKQKQEPSSSPCESKKRKSLETPSSSISLLRAILVTGSYDHSVRVWDLQAALSQLALVGASNKKPHSHSPYQGGGSGTSDAPTLDLANKVLLTKIHNGVPVESLARLKGYEIVVAGGTSLKLWNVLHGKLVRENDTSHSKTITRVFVAPRVGFGCADVDLEARILTSGLDGFVRIYDPSTFNCLHGTRFLFPLLSLAVSPLPTGSDPSNRLLVTGSVDGHLLVQQRPRPSEGQLQEQARCDQQRGMHKDSFLKGGPTSDNYTVHVQREKRLGPFQKALRQFRYGDALDRALETKQPHVVCAVLEELSKRRAGLETALSHRDEESLEPILAFCSRYVITPKFTPLLAGVVHVIVDIYQGVLGQSATIDQLVEKARVAIRGEMSVHQGLMTLIGELDGLLAVADMKHSLFFNVH